MTDQPPLSAATFQIRPDLRVCDLDTPEACDDARMTLMADINKIEMQLIRYDNNLTRDAVWKMRATSAMRTKKFGMQLVQERRGALVKEIKRRHSENIVHKLVEEFRARFPEQFNECLAVVTGRIV